MAFHPWQALIDPSVEICAIQLPGRGWRLSEAPYRSMQDLLDTLTEVIAANLDLPFAFFGHSLGGLLAFEMARRCQVNNLPMPLHLFISGCDAPTRRHVSKTMHQLGDEEFIARLSEYNGTPSELLKHRELMALLLPAIRADFELAASYIYEEQPILSIPISVLSGTRDTPSAPDSMNDWAQQTKASFVSRAFEGDHFFINTATRDVIDFVWSRLSAARL